MENIKWLLSHVYNFISAFVLMVFGYFSEISDVFHLMIAVIGIDLITGIIASHIKGHGIKSIKLWRTVEKLMFSIIVVAITFSMDKELHVIEVHRYVAWLIVGFELWSILENAGKITNHRIFRILKIYMEDKVKKTTGINLNDDEKL